MSITATDDVTRTYFRVRPQPRNGMPEQSMDFEWYRPYHPVESLGLLDRHDVRFNPQSRDGRYEAAIFSSVPVMDTTESAGEGVRRQCCRYRLVISPSGCGMMPSEYTVEWSTHGKFVTSQCQETKRLTVWSVDNHMTGPVFSLEKGYDDISWGDDDKWLVYYNHNHHMASAVVVVSTAEWHRPINVFVGDNPAGWQTVQFVGGQTLAVQYHTREMRLYGLRPTSSHDEWILMSTRMRTMRYMAVRCATNGNECWVDYNWHRARCAIVCPAKMTDGNRREWKLPRFRSLCRHYDHCYPDITWSSDGRYVLITAGNQLDVGGWCVVAYAAPDWQPITWFYFERWGASKKYGRWVQPDVLEYRCNVEAMMLSDTRHVKMDLRSKLRWLDLSRKAAASFRGWELASAT